VLLVVCAAVGLGTLALAQFNTVGQVWAFGNLENDALVYGPVAGLVLALLAWHLSPRRSWVDLLVFGALCAMPAQVFLLTPKSFAGWMETPYLAVSSLAAPVLLVGLLGAASAVWQAGSRAAGAALIGATLLVPPLAGLVIALVVFGVGAFVPVIGLVLAAATVVLAVVAGRQQAEAPSRPGWRVTLGGAVAGLTPLVFHFWRGPDTGPGNGMDPETYYLLAGRHLLAAGLVVLGAGLLAGLLAGTRVLVTGTAAGLLLGGLGELTWPAMFDIRGLPVGIPTAVVIVALAVGVALALPRARVLVGAAGLGVLVLGLAVLWLVFSADDPIFGAGVTHVLTPVLMFVGVVAAVALLASLGSVLAPVGAVPAALAGVVAAVAAGVDGIVTYFTFTNFGARSTTSGTFPPVIVALLCAIGLAVLAHQLWRHPRPVVQPQPAAGRLDTAGVG